MTFLGFQLLTQSALCFVLVLSASGKLAKWEATGAWLTELGIHQPDPRLAVALVATAELCLAFAIVFIPLGGAVLGVAFFAVVFVVLERSRRLGKGCSCFGDMSIAVTLRHFVRAGAMAGGLVILGIMAWTADSGLQVTDESQLVWAPVVVAFAALAPLLHLWRAVYPRRIEFHAGERGIG